MYAMNESGKGSSERGSIEPRRSGMPGLGNLFDFDPFRVLFSGNWNQMLGMNVTRQENGYELEMPVPGFRPEDLDVNYQDGVITVSGRNDRRTLTRSFTVPDDIDEENIQATVEHGMLTITLRRTPQKQARKIAVSTGEQSAQQSSGGAQTAQTTTGTTGTESRATTS
jgi:HSP20 family protein